MSGDDIIRLTRERLPERPVHKVIDGPEDGTIPRTAMDIDGIRVTYRWIFGRWEIDTIIRK